MHLSGRTGNRRLRPQQVGNHPNRKTLLVRFAMSERPRSSTSCTRLWLPMKLFMNFYRKEAHPPAASIAITSRGHGNFC
jgi:hypothetical protein